MLKSNFITIANILFATLCAHASPSDFRDLKLEKTETLIFIDNESAQTGRRINMEISTYSHGKTHDSEIFASFQICISESCENIGQKMNMKVLSFISNFREQEHHKNSLIGTGIGAVAGAAGLVACAASSRCYYLAQDFIDRWMKSNSRLFVIGSIATGAIIGAQVGSKLPIQDTTLFQNFMVNIESYLEFPGDGGFLKVDSLDDFAEQISAYQIRNMNVNQ